MSSLVVMPGPLPASERASLLRLQSLPADGSGVDAHDVVAQLNATLEATPHGTAIAAVQIGIPVRIVVVRMGRPAGSELVLVDPVIVSLSGRLTARREGCLSLPNHMGTVRRRNAVKLVAKDLTGCRFEHVASGYEATVIQHEIDHLDGVLYWDHMASEKPQLIEDQNDD